VLYFDFLQGIVIATLIVGYLINRFFLRLIRNSDEMMKSDKINYQFLGHAATALIYMVGFSIAIYSMPSLRTLASSLLASAGILAVAVGFAYPHHTLVRKEVTFPNS